MRRLDCTYLTTEKYKAKKSTLIWEPQERKSMRRILCVEYFYTAHMYRKTHAYTAMLHHTWILKLNKRTIVRTFERRCVRVVLSLSVRQTRNASSRFILLQVDGVRKKETTAMMFLRRPAF